MQKYALDFLFVTEKAAMSTLDWIGRGNEDAADKAATDVMRQQLNKMDISGQIVIGEGEMDYAPMLYIGEKVGKAENPKVDIAVDPIEGTTPTVQGQENGMTVISAAPKGTLFHAPDMYMKKIAVGEKAKGAIDIAAPLLDNMHRVAKALNKKVTDLTVIMQNRPRHESYIKIIREAGAKVHLFENNDVVASILANIESANIDIMFNIGGAPEGVISAVALKALGGEIQAQLMPENEEQIERCNRMGITNVHCPLLHADLVNSEECIFSATGITNNVLFNGMERVGNKVKTHSILISGNDQKMRLIESFYEYGKK